MYAPIDGVCSGPISGIIVHFVFKNMGMQGRGLPEVFGYKK